MSEAETSKKPRMASSIFASELVICGLLAGMGFRDLLSTFEFGRHSVGHYLLGCALVVVTVWYIHLLSVWKIVYEGIDARLLAGGGLLRLWTNIVYAGLLYLAFHYHYNYRWCLTCLTAVIGFDFFSSGLGYCSRVDMLRQVSRRWLQRDVCLVFALVVAWAIHLHWDPAPSGPNDALEPSFLSGFTCLAGIVLAYWFDIMKNSGFYGAGGSSETPA
ncbi:MAG: hypothetical protein MUC88_26465 [Planctomycetes bacterium]|jgi:hypothetical protein|nr:hypothetical protein [Planctomycetota bacterium]